MKTIALLSVTATALTMVSVSARQMHAELDYERYLAEKEETQADVDTWLKEYKDHATKNGYMPAFESRSTDDMEEDMRQRMHMSKMDVEAAQAANPDANFSIMSPFSMLKKDEFQKTVLNSYIKGDKSKSSKTSSPSRSLRQQSESSYSFSSFQDMWDNLVKKMQEQMGTGTVKPATNEDATVSNNNHAAQWSVVEPSAAPQTPCPESKPKTRAPTAAPTPAPTPSPTPTTRAPVVEPVTKKPTTNALVQKTEGTSGNGYAVDWASTVCMSPVQSQGQCGSCWAFASIAAVETLQCIKYGWSRPNKFAEQQLVGCDTQNWGCGGGAPVYAFEYIQQNGLCAESDLPYEMSNGGTASCSANCKKYGTGLTGYEHLDEGDESGLIEVLKSQPVVVSVASGNAAWKQYTGGVMSYCETTELDHAVLIVGYNDNEFKVRNSWGDYWGENGYVRMKRSSGTGTCGMLTDMSRPKI